MCQGGGYQEATLNVQGDGAWTKFKFESGVHRVQRVPTTEKAGRVHTSTATVAIMPEAVRGRRGLFSIVSLCFTWFWGARPPKIMGGRRCQVEEASVDESEAFTFVAAACLREKIMKEIKFQFCRSGGKGGQNVNKAA